MEIATYLKAGGLYFFMIYKGKVNPISAPSQIHNDSEYQGYKNPNKREDKKRRSESLLRKSKGSLVDIMA